MIKAIKDYFISGYCRLCIEALEDYENWKVNGCHFEYKKNEKIELSFWIANGVHWVKEEVKAYQFNIIEKIVLWEKIKWTKAQQLEGVLKTD